jgi:hypothetical protein
MQVKESALEPTEQRFPSSSVFFFVLGKLGQNEPNIPQYGRDLQWINPIYAQKILIHCAFDRQLFNNTIWFKTNVVAAKLGKFNLFLFNN